MNTVLSPPEVIFDRYLRRLPMDQRELYRGRMDLSKFVKPEMAPAFEAIMGEINMRWSDHAARIRAPGGEVKLHLDYIDSTGVNAITFYDRGIHFVGITDKMLAHFTGTCELLWQLNPLYGLLRIKAEREVRDFLFQVILLIQLQFIAYHELGHLFHGHVDSSALNEEFKPDSGEDGGESEQLRNQAHEVEADGYAVHLLVDNLLSSASGRPIYERLASELSMEDCILTLFLVAVGSLFFFLKAKPFKREAVRVPDHPFGLVRMNVVMYDLTGWCKTKRPDLVEWATVDRFQRIMTCVAQAAESTDQAQSWSLQGKFLRSDSGKRYIDDLYAERAKLRAEMDPQAWTLLPPREASSL
jgi:hypothetical protein